MQTYKSFYRVLQEIAPQFKWKIARKGKIRAVDKNGKYFCPLTAIYYARQRSRLQLGEYSVAANEIRLPYNMADNIVIASDMSCDQDENIRKSLLSAVGLK